ncbi:MAG: DNA adenine methylase [Oscillospiraceae bacterium]|nr:DNA adenine methylase [Oscillospiraceae bacterium]
MNNKYPIRPVNGGAESEAYLTEQIITYLGNKRSLLSFIGTAVSAVKEQLGKDKLDIVDMFSGSGVVSRFFKQHASTLYANDLEDYCRTINRCYLSNRGDIDFDTLRAHYTFLVDTLRTKPLRSGFIAEMYAPTDDQNIQKGERVFFTTRNARYLDTARQLMETIPEPYKTFLLAPLLYEASVHNNTGGVFKGFYKNSKTGIGQYGGDGQNALQRIRSDMHLKLPVFSNFQCKTVVLQKDANALAAELPRVDLVYMDPPYNQHPYGSNYFMLNLINNYQRPDEVSRVSGIPTAWNKSSYNKKQTARSSMFDLCSALNTKYLLISFSSDGFIGKDEMIEMLSSLGKVQILDRAYNTFRACRNLSGRDIHVKEYLYLVEKDLRFV